MKEKKGFTLVELLAVVVILGIIMMISIPAITRWIDRGKNESIESQKKALLMAAQSYAQANVEILPKTIGQSTTVTANDLKQKKYLQEDLVNTEKKSCMDSYVKINKINQKLYDYKVYFYCDGENAPVNDDAPPPTISVHFNGEDGSGDTIQNVAVSSFRLVITGGQEGSTSLKLEGYSYSISVRYTGDSNDNIVEIYNSGSISASGKETVVVEKSLSVYTDISKVNDFIITVEAYNKKGGHKKIISSSTYHDEVPPICGNVSGEARDEYSYLTQKGDSRTISVDCSDGEGSGCVKKTFTKTFDEQMEFGTIQISDNAGNTTDCVVRVNIDWTEPTLSVSAYVRNADGSNGAFVGSVGTALGATEKNLWTNELAKTYHGWLNIENYSNGINYVFTVKDNIKLLDGQWSYNRGSIYNEQDPNYQVLNDDKTKDTFSADNEEVTKSIKNDGKRLAKYTVSDRSGYTATINLSAFLDRVPPTATLAKTHLDTESGVYVTATCTDLESQCQDPNPYTYKNVKATNNYYVRDKANNVNTMDLKMEVSNYSCHPYQYECGKKACGKRCKDKCCMRYGGYRCDKYDCFGEDCWTKYCAVYCTGYNTCYR